jgi:hypothetical protein
MAQRGWLTKHQSKRNGWTWVYHCYRAKPETGKRVEAHRYDWLGSSVPESEGRLGRSRT